MTYKNMGKVNKKEADKWLTDDIKEKTRNNLATKNDKEEVQQKNLWKHEKFEDKNVLKNIKKILVIAFFLLGMTPVYFNIYIFLNYPSTKSEILAFVEHSNASSKNLDMFARNSDEEVRASVASNYNVSSETLKKLAFDKSTWVRLQVAKNPKTSKNILEILVKDSNEKIKREVAKHPNTYPKVLEKLAFGNSVYVKENVAANPNTPPKVLEILKNDKNPSVRKRARLNYSTPKHEEKLHDK